VSPVRYEVGFHISKDGIIHSRRRENFKHFLKVSAFETTKISYKGYVTREEKVDITRKWRNYEIPNEALLCVHTPCHYL
jgi:hypothetical protein